MLHNNCVLCFYDDVGDKYTAIVIKWMLIVDDDDSDEYDEEAEDMDAVTTRFDGATKLGARQGVNVTSGEEVGDLKARIEEMKKAMAFDAMKRMDGGEDDGSDFGGFDDLEETKSR